MPKNIKIDGKTYNDVSALKATDADNDEIVSFSDTSDATATAADIKLGQTAYANGAKIHGTNTDIAESYYNQFIEGAITSFVMPKGNTYIAPYLFYQFTNLTNVDLGDIENISDYAFCECRGLISVASCLIKKIGNYTFRNCASLTDIDLSNAVYLGSSALYGCSNIKTIDVKNINTLGSYALYGCNALTSLEFGEILSTGNNAIGQCMNLTHLKIKINGEVGSYTFAGCTKMNNFDLDKDSNITTLGTNAFYDFGYNRTSDNVITLDFTKSTFETIPSHSFATSSTTRINKYLDIYFSESVTAIESHAFANANYCNIHFNSIKPPTLAATTTWSNSLYYKIFVPYNSINEYKKATNWTAHSKYIYGYVPNNILAEGDILPSYNIEGYSLTWFKNAALTISASVVESPNAIYYCTCGTTKNAFGIKTIYTEQCSVVITDGTKFYKAGEGVLKNTVVTITAIPSIDGYIPYHIEINGKNFVNGDTFVMDKDIDNILALCYDGHEIPLKAIFAENSWETICNAYKTQTNIATNLWKIGDTKPITLTNGNAFTIRIVDLQPKRYSLASSSSYANAVFEFKELYTTTSLMNGNMSNVGGWADCYMKNKTMETIFNLLPTDLKTVISEVNVLSGIGNNTTSGTSSSINKLFLPSHYEIFGTNGSSIGESEGSPQLDYYRINNVKETRIKKINTTSNTWWLRSPYINSTKNYCAVSVDGNAGVSDSSSSFGVALFFAI